MDIRYVGHGIWSSEGIASAAYSDLIKYYYSFVASGGGTVNLFADELIDISSSQCSVSTVCAGYPSFIGGSGTKNAGVIGTGVHISSW